MASIINDKETNGKWLVRAIGRNGEDIEQYCNSHAEAQTIADIETFYKLHYFDEFKVIDGVNQHKDGLNFREWLKRISPMASNYIEQDIKKQ